jgi:hypothetical protein
MRIALPLFLSLAGVVRCAAQTAAPIRYENLPGVAIYNDGYLISWNSPVYSMVTFYGRDRQRVYSVSEHEDGIYHVAWTIDSDGVAAGAYQARDAWVGRIDIFNPTGKLTRTINTGSYVPQHVAFAPDHTIWAAGYQAENDGREDFNVLHHYARTGKELGQLLQWSQIAGDENSYTALQPIIGGRWLYTGNDRIGLQVESDFGHSTWIEVSYSGALLGKYNLGTPGEVCYSLAGMTADGTVYAAISVEDTFSGWAVLDHSNHAWHKIAGPSAGQIIGSDGENLVFSQHDGDSTVLQLVPSHVLRPEKPRHAGALISRR